MSIKLAIEALKNHDFTAHLGDILAEIHEAHGFPEPPGGPSTDTRGPALFSTEDVGDWNGNEQTAADLMTGAIKGIYQAIDCHYCGGVIWTRQHGLGSAEWQAYLEEAEGAIDIWMQRADWIGFDWLSEDAD